MEKVLTAVVTTLLCSIFGGEEQESKATKIETKKTIKEEYVEPKKHIEAKAPVDFTSVDTA